MNSWQGNSNDGNGWMLVGRITHRPIHNSTSIMTNPDIHFLDAHGLACFCAAAEELHFGRAAARMFMSQPPFSQQIKRLEQQVGVALFVRTTRSVRLTPAGMVMLRHAKKIAGETARMLRETEMAARGEAGSLVIGLAPTVAYAPIAETLYRFRIDHPSIEVELREMNSVSMEAKIQQRDIDLALMRPIEMDATITSHEVFREPLVVALRADHPWSAKRRIAPAQVAELPLLGYSPTASPYFRALLHSIFATAGRHPRYVQESIIPTILTLAEVGVGAAIVPLSLMQNRSRSLVSIPLQIGGESMARIVVASRTNCDNLAAQALITRLQKMRRSA